MPNRRASLARKNAAPSIRLPFDGSRVPFVVHGRFTQGYAVGIRHEWRNNRGSAASLGEHALPSSPLSLLDQPTRRRPAPGLTLRLPLRPTRFVSARDSTLLSIRSRLARCPPRYRQTLASRRWANQMTARREFSTGRVLERIDPRDRRHEAARLLRGPGESQWSFDSLNPLSRSKFHFDRARANAPLGFRSGLARRGVEGIIATE